MPFGRGLWSNSCHRFLLTRRERRPEITQESAEVPIGFEPMCEGFANLCLTAWLRHHEAVGTCSASPSACPDSPGNPLERARFSCHSPLAMTSNQNDIEVSYDVANEF